MHGRKIRSIAALSAASLVAQPLIVGAGGCAQVCPIAATIESGPSTTNALSLSTATMAPVSPISVPPLYIVLLPISALSPAAIETQRGAIAQIMIELGEDEDRARQVATELSADDLAVLMANPKMMQKAGDLALIVIVVVIVGGIVALALAADSAVIVSN
jgi:hypothetical protein